MPRADCADPARPSRAQARARSAYEQCPPDDVERVRLRWALRTHLCDAYTEKQNIKALLEVIKLDYRMCEDIPSGQPLRAALMPSIADAAATLAPLTGLLTVMDWAIARTREVLENDMVVPGDRTLDRVSLTRLLVMRARKVEDAQPGLQEAVASAREALERPPTDPKIRERAYDHLSTILTQMTVLTREETLHGDMINLHRQALALQLPGSSGYSNTCGNLAISLLSGAVRKDRAVLDEAVRLQKSGLDLCPADYRNRSGLCNGLAMTLYLLSKFEADSVPTLRQALVFAQMALQDSHPDTTIRAKYFENFAKYLRAVQERAPELAPLDAAIQIGREELQRVSTDRPGRPFLLRALVRLLRTRMDIEVDASLLEETTRLEEEYKQLSATK